MRVTSHRLGDERIVSCPANKYLGCWWMKSWTWADNGHSQPKSTTGSRWRKLFCSSSLVKSHLQSCIHHWGPSTGEIHGPLRAGPEQGHGSGRRAVAPLLWDKAESWGCSVWRRPWRDLNVAFRYLKDAKLFNKTCWDRTRDNGFKVEGARFRLDIRQQIFTMRMVRIWNRLSGEMVDALFLETGPAVQGQLGLGSEQLAPV